MKRELQGQYVTVSTVGEKAQAFVPAPLPPIPGVDWSPQLRARFDGALLSLGKLDSVSTLLPDTSLFIYMYVRKEAVLSSMIEGTQSSLADLLLFELDEELVALGLRGLELAAQGLDLRLHLLPLLGGGGAAASVLLVVGLHLLELGLLGREEAPQ